MTYITTNHRFIIDDKHPSDVFDEMENFFSLFTTAIDHLQQVSVQLSVPASFDITANKKIAESYRQFTKSLKYTLPDIHILPIKTHKPDGQDDTTASDADNSVILLIQRFDGEGIDADETPSFYQSVLGKLIPRFAGERTDAGLYPAQEPINLPAPNLPAMPVSQPSVQPPQPAVTPPNTQPTYQSDANRQYQARQSVPQSQPPVQPVPSLQPPIQPTIPPVTPPLTPPPVVTSSAQSVVQSQPLPRPTSQAASQVSMSATPAFSVLPNILKSTKPYQDLLTQAIVNEAKKWLDKTQVISQITLTSNDGLTTAMIEQLFDSFHQAHNPVNQSQVTHDAIDLVSYGYEVLKPQLAAIGVTLSDEAQFALKTKAQATSADIARLARGEVFSNEIKLGVKLATQSAIATTNSNHLTASQPTAAQSGQVPFQEKPLPQHLNQNLQHIVLVIKCMDGLGERQQKVREFPIVFASRDAHIPHALRLFAPNEIRLASGVYFSIVESQGQVLIDAIDPQVTISRNGQPVKLYDVLMPNDELVINDTMRVQLLLAN